MTGKSLILHLGRLHQKKGLDLLIEAFSRVAGRRNDAHLVLAGSGDSGYYVMRIAQMLRSRRFDRATITGQLDDDEKFAVLRDADVFVLPSMGRILEYPSSKPWLAVFRGDFRQSRNLENRKEAEAGIVTTCQSEKIAECHRKTPRLIRDYAWLLDRKHEA